MITDKLMMRKNYLGVVLALIVECGIMWCTIYIDAVWFDLFWGAFCGGIVLYYGVLYRRDKVVDVNLLD
jgi:hypothetical protein